MDKVASENAETNRVYRRRRYDPRARGRTHFQRVARHRFPLSPNLQETSIGGVYVSFKYGAAYNKTGSVFYSRIVSSIPPRCVSLSPPVKNKQHECRVNRESRCGREGGRGKKKGTGRWRKKEAADIHIYGERRGKGLDRSRFRSDQIGRGWHR